MTKSTGSAGWLGMLVLVGFFSSAARAEEEYAATAGPRAQALSNALEVTVGLGSAQGYGNNSSGDIGVGTNLGVGWRIDRHWMIGAYGEGAVYSGTSSTVPSLGAAAGVQANYHFDVTSQPWVGLGTGWRGYWLGQESGRTAHQGLDLVRLQAGFDVPISRSFALAPVLGATLSTFLWQSGPDTAGSDRTSKDLSVFVFAGALARFDFFGRTSTEVVLASK